MISRILSVSIIIFCAFFPQTGYAQTANNNSVYLFYILSTNDTSLSVHNHFFGARMESSFSTSDYEKILNLSAQRVWRHANAGDSLRNYNLGIDMGPLYSTDQKIDNAQYLSLADLNKDATVFGSNSPELSSWHINGDRFRLKNNVVVSQNLWLGKDLRFVTSIDTVEGKPKKGKPPITLQNHYLEPSAMAISFVEKWSFDPSNGNFIKNVNMIGYLSLKIDPVDGEHIGYSPCIFLDNPNGIYNASVDVPLKKNVICDESVQLWDAILKYDSAYKYSPSETIDMMQGGFSGISSFERVKFISSLFYYAFQNPTKVFPVKNNVIDSSHAFQSAKEISKLFSIWDSTFQCEYPPQSGIFIKAPLLMQVSMSDIYAIRFYEDWFYDPKEMTIKKKVNGIGFVLLKVLDNGKTEFSDAGIYIKVH